MSKSPRIKVTAEELYRRVLIDTVIRLFNAYKDMVVVRELLHAAFPGDKAEIDRFLAETSRTTESLHEVSESAPKRTAGRSAPRPFDPTAASLRKVRRPLGSISVQAGVKDVWNAFLSRIKSLLGGIASIDSAMDDAIAAVESVAGTEAQASMRHILTNKRADILEVQGSKEALKNSTILPLFAKLFKVQPIALGPLAQSSDHLLYAREVQIPRIPEAIRPQVMAVINQTAIKPEVEEAMKLLMGMKKANAELAAKVKQVQEAYGSNESLKKAVPKATETVLAYVKKLTSKQRRLDDAIFRATSRVKRGNVDYKTVVETLRAAAEQADAVLAAEIDKLLAANTRESENVDDLEIILDQVPQEARDQLREMSAPAPSAPATVPQS